MRLWIMVLVFHVGSAYTKRFIVKNRSLEDFTTAEAEWRFRFFGEDTGEDGITTRTVNQSGNDIHIDFDLESDFFTEARVGSCQWQVILRDVGGDEVPVFHTTKYIDRVELPI